MSNQYLKLRRSGVPGKIPTTSSLDFGEIALNTYDGLAFMKKSGSNGEEIISIGSSSGSFSGIFTGQFSGSFSGSGANLFNIPASGIVGLNLSQIASGSYSASISENGLLVNNRVVAPSFTGSLFGTASNAISSSFAPNIYNTNGTLSGTRTLTLGGNSLDVVGSSITRFFSNGRVGIGTTIDGGFQLDVNGTLRAQGQVTTTTADAQFGNIGAATGRFRIDGENGSGYGLSFYSSDILRFGVTGFGGTFVQSGLTVENSLNSGGGVYVQNGVIRIRETAPEAHLSILGDGALNLINLKTSNGVTVLRTSENGVTTIGPESDVPSAVFSIFSTNRGFLPPRSSNPSLDITSPAQGLISYATSDSIEGLYYFNSSSYQGWTRLLNNSGSQTISGSLNIGDSTVTSVYKTRRIASTTVGVNVIYSLPTSSFDGIFVDYTIRSGSVGRVGNFMAMWYGSQASFTDNSINGFGDTTGFVFGASVSGNNLIVTGSGVTGGWNVKTIIRSI